MKGRYLFADYVVGRVWALREDDTAELIVGLSGQFLASFAESNAGELYLLSFDGRIYELTRR